MSEELYPIPGWPNYFITKEGKVYSEQKGVISEKRQCNHNHGYLVVSLWINGKGKNQYVHRLMAVTFLNLTKDKDVNHLNGNKKDNRLINLEVCTRSENILHSYRLGMHTPTRGEKGGNSKLKIEQVREIRQLLKEGTLSMPKIGALYGVSGDCIFGIKTNTRWQFNH